MKIRTIISTALLSLAVTGMSAQEQIVIEPLFEYVSAPDDMDGLQER